MKDTIASVTALIKKVIALRKKTAGEVRGYWSVFLKECRDFIKAEKKRLAAKFEALRFAADGQAENIHSLLKSDSKENQELAKTVLFKNKNLLAGYLMYCKKNHKETPRNEYCHVGDFIGCGFWNIADVARIVRMYAKEFLKGQYTVKIERFSMGQSINIRFKGNSKDWSEGKKLLEFLQKFNKSYRYDAYDTPSYRFYTGLQ